jgi:tetratricopeptide (TPR) repeat protein
MRKYILITILLISYISVSAQYNSADTKLLAFKNSIEKESIGQYSDAILELINIYDKYNSEYVINLRLGWLYYLNKDYDNSIKYYKKALQISGDKSIEAIFGITLPLSAKGDWDSVKSYYEDVIRMDENNYTANLRLGQIYLNTENYLNAKVYLSKVKEMYPGDYETNLYLGWTYYYLGDKSSAFELFTNVLTLSPEDNSALEGLKLVE